MKKKLSFLFLAASLIWLPMRSQDVILQGFYWNPFPGDVTDAVNGGVWWDSLAILAPDIAGAGFNLVWTPPPNKGFGNLWDVGYGLYDYYDFGDYNQKGSTRTRYGQQQDLEAAISALHNQGVDVMCDIVLNHRGGADGQQFYQGTNTLGFTDFNPASGRFPGDSSHFHPNNVHGTNNEYTGQFFFEDICYFNGVDTNPPNGGWYKGPPPMPGISGVADSLIAWGRFLVDSMKFDAFRIDAIKHIDPYFLANFLPELSQGAQPYAVGEFFDSDLNKLATYQDQVTDLNNNNSKATQFSIYDFPWRFGIRDVLNDGSGGQDITNKISSTNLVWNSSIVGFESLTWIENHDTDRIGWVGSNPPDCDRIFGGSCLKLDTDSGHDPVVQDKEDMGYPLLMAAEGRPTVFWKDFYWYGLGDAIEWVMTLREATATGGSTPMGNLNPFHLNSGSNADLFAMTRSGLNAGEGLILALNDNNATSREAFVNSPFQNVFVRDYSWGWAFIPRQVFNDTRVQVSASPRDYAWWALTGLYPTPPGNDASAFTLDATPGGNPHYIVLRVQDSASFLVNGSPIDFGDQVAVKNANGDVVGIGRVGQKFGWDKEHDMVIEVLGPFPTDSNPVGGAANGMAVNEAFRFEVFDASVGNTGTVAAAFFAPVATNASVDLLRPNTPNRQGTLGYTTTATSTYQNQGQSLLTSFAATILSAGPIDLQARPNGQQVALNWQIDGSQAFTSFEYEMRPAGAGRFQLLGQKAAQSGQSSYQATTQALASGTYAFRIKGYTVDGAVRYSPIVSARIEPPLSLELRAFPQPAEGPVHFQLDLAYRQHLRLDLFDATGRNLQTLYDGPAEGTFDWRGDLPEVAAGVYILRAEAEQGGAVLRIAVRK